MKTLSVICLVGAITASCGAAQQNQDKLRETVLLFNEGIRWGRLQDVMPHLYSENAAHFIEMHKEFGKEIQISDYEIINWVIHPESKKADINVQFVWYRLSEVEVHETIVTQHWEKQAQGWFLIAEEFVSGEPFAPQ